MSDIAKDSLRERFARTLSESDVEDWRIHLRKADLILVSVRKEVESLESDVILCQAPALEVPYVDIGEPLPV
jgi:hypothetical protein